MVMVFKNPPAAQVTQKLLELFVYICAGVCAAEGGEAVRRVSESVEQYAMRMMMSQNIDTSGMKALDYLNSQMGFEEVRRLLSYIKKSTACVVGEDMRVPSSLIADCVTGLDAHVPSAASFSCTCGWRAGAPGSLLIYEKAWLLSALKGDQRS